MIPLGDGDIILMIPFADGGLLIILPFVDDIFWGW